MGRRPDADLQGGAAPDGHRLTRAGAVEMARTEVDGGRNAEAIDRANRNETTHEGYNRDITSQAFRVSGSRHLVLAGRRSGSPGGRLGRRRHGRRGADRSGTAWTSSDGGVSWTGGAALGAAPRAVAIGSSAAGAPWIAVVTTAAVVESTDGGRTFDVVLEQ